MCFQSSGHTGHLEHRDRKLGFPNSRLNFKIRFFDLITARPKTHKYISLHFRGVRRLSYIATWLTIAKAYLVLVANNFSSYLPRCDEMGQIWGKLPLVAARRELHILIHGVSVGRAAPIFVSCALLVVLYCCCCDATAVMKKNSNGHLQVFHVAARTRRRTVTFSLQSDDPRRRLSTRTRVNDDDDLD